MSGIQQFLLPTDNPWTGTNTFYSHNVIQNSLNNTVYWPTLQDTYLGYTPTSRLQYGRQIAGTDNPDSLHSQLSQTINWNQFNSTSDDGTGTYNLHQLEHRYQGPAVANITSIVTAAGTGTFTVNSTSLLYAGGGFAVRGNSVSSNNAFWKITAITDGTHFTATLSSGTATTGTGTGGDIRADQEEENATMSGTRWLSVRSNNGNPAQDGSIAFNYPTGITVPTNYASSGGFGSGCFSIDGSQSTANGDITMFIRNSDPTSATSKLVWYNTKTGKNWTFGIDRNGAGADNYFSNFNGSDYSAVVGAATPRMIFGAGIASDDTITPFQFVGAMTTTGNIKTTGHILIGTSVLDDAPITVKGSALTASVANGAEFAPSTGATSYIHYGTTGDIYWRSASSSGKVVLNDGGGNVQIGNASGTTAITGEVTVTSGNVTTSTIGKTLAVKSGTNAKAGTFTLVAGTVTVSNTSVTANSVIQTTIKTIGGTGQIFLLIIPTAATGFTVSGAATDTSTYNFIITEVN